ncbi:hypothetical protein DFH09DRAFT_1325562 [Mycena vulgaris]|nr:hypothetical protein DFH09DRAFT_1325562 [Mycena vulgaris]
MSYGVTIPIRITVSPAYSTRRNYVLEIFFLSYVALNPAVLAAIFKLSSLDCRRSHSSNSRALQDGPRGGRSGTPCVSVSAGPTRGLLRPDRGASPRALPFVPVSQSAVCASSAARARHVPAVARPALASVTLLTPPAQRSCLYVLRVVHRASARSRRNPPCCAGFFRASRSAHAALLLVSVSEALDTAQQAGDDGDSRPRIAGHCVYAACIRPLLV